METIRQNFEQNYCYIVFEGNEAPDKSGEFEKIISFLHALKKGVIGTDIHHDQKCGKIYLIVKLESEHSDSIVEELYHVELSKNFTLYIYGAHLTA